MIPPHSSTFYCALSFLYLIILSVTHHGNFNLNNSYSALLWFFAAGSAQETTPSAIDMLILAHPIPLLWTLRYAWPESRPRQCCRARRNLKYQTSWSSYACHLCHYLSVTGTLSRTAVSWAYCRVASVADSVWNWAKWIVYMATGKDIKLATFTTGWNGYIHMVMAWTFVSIKRNGTLKQWYENY
jgi:hypothetical protein